MTTKFNLMALFIALFFSSSSYADVDYTCQNSCIGKGYMLQYCQQACSYNNNSQSSGGIDYSHGAAGAYNSLQQQQFQNQQTAAQNQQQMQMRELEMEKLRLENEKLKQELNK